MHSSSDCVQRSPRTVGGVGWGWGVGVLNEESVGWVSLGECLALPTPKQSDGTRG